MPMRARAPSTATHSCSSLYRSSSGKSISPGRFRYGVPASGHASAASPSHRVDSATASRPPATPPLHLHHIGSIPLRRPGLRPRLPCISMGEKLLEDLADALHVLLREAAGVDVAAGLRPHVREGLVGVGQHERPPLAVDDLHAVYELELPGPRALDDLAHHRALAFPRRDDR